MLTALSTALSALNAQSTAIDVVGNNLANLNTTGFKAESSEFFDLVSQTVGGAQTQVGMGVGTPITERVFSQGSVQNTSNPLDVAIQGSGFLVTKDANGATLYTRAGDLKQDQDGNLTDATGNFIQGWTAVNGVVGTSTPLGNLTIPTGSLSAPVATQNISLTANLDSNTTPVASPWAANQAYTVGETVVDASGHLQQVTAAGTSGGAAPAWNDAGGTTTDNGVTWSDQGVADTPANASLSQDVQVYDSLGNAHMVTLNFWKNPSAANTWDWSASVPSSDLSGSGSVSGSGTLQFDATGQLISPASGTSPQISITGLADGANDMTVNFNLYNGNNPLITQYAQSSSSSSNNADGSAAGQLSSVAITKGGSVVASYSNGKQVTVGQLAMANFANPDSLLAVGNNLYQVTGATSNPSIGLANTGGRGQIEGSSLESSTADIATEFTNLMVDQRSYEANSKVVTTTDTLNQDVINLIH